jgi:ribosomal protein L37AE/L43A/uncharacterized protein YggL (DUF469 family)
MPAIEPTVTRYAELLRTLDYELLKVHPPACPHCGNAMSLCYVRNAAPIWENSLCACWWKGAQDAVYTHQVDRELTADEIRLAAPDAATAQTILDLQAEIEAAAKADSDFQRALRYEQQNDRFMKGSDDTRLMLLQFELGAHGKHGKTFRKMIRRWLAERRQDEDLETSVRILNHWRSLAIRGVDPFRQ